MALFDEAFFDEAYFDEPDVPIHRTYMRDITTYFENPFDAVEISIPELLDYSGDHLQRMLNNNPAGAFTQRITATQAALNIVSSSTSSDIGKLGVRKIKKGAKDAFRKSLPGKIEKIAAVVTAKFGSGALPEYLPKGRSAFTKCKDDLVKENLEVLRDALLEHQSDLGEAVVTDAQTLVNDWDAVFGDSESAGGAKTETASDLKTARQNLQLELFRNLLTLALAFPRQPEKATLYMQQSLLENRQRGNGNSQPPTPPPAPPA